jgi:hypothetical protein
MDAASGYRWLADEAQSVAERFSHVLCIVQALLDAGSDREAHDLLAASLDFLARSRSGQGALTPATVDDARSLLARWPGLSTGAD